MPWVIGGVAAAIAFGIGFAVRPLTKGATNPFSQESPEAFLFDIKPTTTGNPAPLSPAAPTSFPGGPPQSGQLAFKDEGFVFAMPQDHWDRVSLTQTPFTLLQPVLALQRTDSSPVSAYGIGACDVAICVEAYQPDPTAEEPWRALTTLRALQHRFGCGEPEVFKVAQDSTPVPCLRLVWSGSSDQPGQMPWRLEAWVAEMNGIAWTMVGLMPGSGNHYALTKTMERLRVGLTCGTNAPPVVRENLARRDLAGSIPHPEPIPAGPLYEWPTPPTGLQTWPGGNIWTPGADLLLATPESRLAVTALPADGMENLSSLRLVTALKRIWPLLREATFPGLDTATLAPDKTARLSFLTNYNNQSVKGTLLLRPTAKGWSVALAIHTPGPASAAAAPDSFLSGLNLAVPPKSAFPFEPGKGIHVPLLESLAQEAMADGRFADASHFQQALYRQTASVEDLSAACAALASAGHTPEALKLLDDEGTRFSSFGWWPIYRTIVLARLGAGANAQQAAMDLLMQGQFSPALISPYLEALISSKCWPQAKAFTALLVRVDRESPLWRLYYANILGESGDRSKCAAIIHATQQNWPDDPMLGIACLDQFIRLRLQQDAATLAARLVTAHPRNDQIQLMAGQCFAMLGRNQEARDAFQKALAIYPGSIPARTSLERLTASVAQSDHTFIAPWLEAVWLPASLRKNLPDEAAARTAFPNQPAIVLSRITGLRHQRGRPMLSTLSSRVLILNAEGMSQWNTLTFPVHPLFQRVCIHYANVLSPDGKIIAQASLADRYSVDHPGAGKTVNLPIPGLVPGCTLDYAVTTQSPSGEEGMEYTRHLFALPEPCLTDLWFITGDTTKLTWSHFAKRDPIRAGDLLLWREDQPMHLTGSSTQGLQREDLPILHIGTVTEDWAHTGTHYLDKIRHRLTTDPDIKSAALAASQNAKTRPEKIAALSRLVRQDISYTAIEFGTRAIIPNAPEVTLKNRYGDCKDHSVLLHSLLEAVGIPSFPALINSRADINPAFPDMSQFDHMITALPDGKGGMDFIDCTDKYLEPTTGCAPSHLASRHALVLDPAGPKLWKTASSQSLSQATLKQDVAIVEERDAVVTDHLTLTGPAAASLRGMLSAVSPSDQLGLLRKMLGLDRLREQLRDFQLSGLKDSTIPLQLTLTWEARGALHRAPEGLQLQLPTPVAEFLLFPDDLLEEAAAGRVTVTSPIRLTTTTTITPPPGLALTAVAAAPGKGATPLGTWEHRSTATSLTWTAETKAGQWTGADAKACATHPEAALASLRQGWHLAPTNLAGR